MGYRKKGRGQGVALFEAAVEMPRLVIGRHSPAAMDGT